MLFVGKGLEKPNAKRFGRRLDESLVAAVGLREDLRRRVIELALARLVDSQVPHDCKVVCARLLVQLDCREDDWGGVAAKVLLADMASTLPADRASALASQMIDLARKTTDRHSLIFVLKLVGALASKLSPEQLSVVRGQAVVLEGYEKATNELR